MEQLGCDLNQSLWTARALITDRDAILRAHLTYLDAGAQCIISGSYQASLQAFESIGIEHKEAEELILRSIDIAHTAVDSYQKSNPKKFRPLVAASIGPYGALLADGSEYHGNYGVTDELLHQFHISKIHLLDKSNADILAIETIPSYQESQVLAEILTEVKKKTWISFSCKDEDHINDGTPIVQCLELFDLIPTVFAVGVNCTHPKYISGLIKKVKTHSKDKKVIVYPNSGELYDATTKTWLNTANTGDISLLAREWHRLGADIIGGCCRIGPAEIEAIGKVINSV